MDILKGSNYSLLTQSLYLLLYINFLDIIKQV